MRIDAHQHFWRYDPVRYGWISEEMRALRRDFLPADLRPLLAENAIDATVAVQTEHSEDETHFLLELADENPVIAGVVGWVDLRAANLKDRLRHFATFEKLRGFRHVAQAEPEDRFLAREDFVRGVAMLGSFDFTYDILIYPRQLPAAAELAERFPDQRFVVDHLAKPRIETGEIEPWASGIRRIAACENVYCKLSGMVTEADWRAWKPEDFKPYLEVVFEAFGPRRLMFGSDWPVCLVAATYTQVKELVAQYAGSHRERIFGGNAAHFYGLKVFADGSAAR